MDKTEYILGTHDAEITRLQLQHKVWQERMRDCWRRAGVGLGQTVLDIGCGPGFAALELAAIVGPTGQVNAYERSERFLSHLDAKAIETGISNIERTVIDFDCEDFPQGQADASWCRWVLSFVSNPERLVKNLYNAIRPGGVVIFHEYVNYSTWQIAPDHDAFNRFVSAVMSSWRTAGGEPDIGLRLPTMLHDSGFEITTVSPIVDMVTPADFTWQWPEAFLRTNITRLIDLGEISSEEAQAAINAFETVKSMPSGRMVTPIVLEIIAHKP